MQVNIADRLRNLIGWYGNAVVAESRQGTDASALIYGTMRMQISDSARLHQQIVMVLKEVEELQNKQQEKTTVKTIESATKEAKFWFVWNDGGHAPRTKHWTREKAEKEAERLAECAPGQRFIVLESLCTIRMVRPITKTEHAIDATGDIPF